MQISISERLRPFSHQAGAYCVLPLTPLSFQIFPALIRIFDLSKGVNQVDEIKLDIQGPVLDFTVQQSLEEGYIKVWGHSKQGYFRYRIHPTSSGFSIAVEKQPEGMEISKFDDAQPIEKPGIEHLSLGVSKGQDWTLIHRRLLLSEILPFWFALGQLVPAAPSHNEGTAALLQKIQLAIEKRDYSNLSQEFNSLYLAGFDGILSPRLVDEQFQGVDIPAVSSGQHSPLVILSHGYAAIRCMFVQQTQSNVSILPCLLPEFHCGRMTNISLGALGSIDIEWSKKTIRRMIFRCQKEGELLFTFQKDLKQYRLRSGKSKGEAMQCNQPVFFQSENDYLFDNFTR